MQDLQRKALQTKHTRKALINNTYFKSSPSLRINTIGGFFQTSRKMNVTLFQTLMSHCKTKPAPAPAMPEAPKRSYQSCSWAHPEANQTLLLLQPSSEPSSGSRHGCLGRAGRKAELLWGSQRGPSGAPAAPQLQPLLLGHLPDGSKEEKMALATTARASWGCCHYGHPLGSPTRWPSNGSFQFPTILLIWAICNISEVSSSKRQQCICDPPSPALRAQEHVIPCSFFKHIYKRATIPGRSWL